MAKFGYIKGTVGFYGKTNKYKSDEKEYCLRIDHPQYIKIDVAALEEAFPLPKSKKDNDRPTKIDCIINDEAVDKMFFNSSYPISKVWVKEEGGYVAHEVTNPDLTGKTVLMTLTGTHIGAIAMEEMPAEYSPNPFSMDDFETEDDLPFN